MTRPLLASLLACTVLVSCADVASESAPSNEADERAIRAVLEGWVAASIEGDAEAYGSFITEDFAYMGPGAPAIDGKAKVVEWVSGFFGATSFEFDWGTEEIMISGDFAVHRYSGVATMQSQDGGEQRLLDRKYIDVLRRVDGRWLISHHIYNLNE